MSTFLDSVDWDKAENLWSTTHRIWSGNLVTVEVEISARAGGGVGAKKRESKYTDKTITVRVFFKDKEFSMTKIKREYTDVKAKHIAERIMESLKPNIKIKVRKIK